MEEKQPTNGKNTPEPSTISLTYELFILIITITALLGLAAWVLVSERLTHREALQKIDVLFCAIFLVDFLRSFYLAPDRKAYLKWGWLDLVGSIPAHPLFRLARLPRARQALLVLRHRKASQLANDMKENQPRSAFLITSLVAILVISIGSLAVLEFESHTPGANINAGADAVWWAFVTVTTVGYGDHVPVSGAARFLAMLMMLVGIGIFGVLTSYLAHWFVTTAEEELKADIVEMKADTTTMKDDIAAMTSDLGDVQTELATIKRLLQEQNRSPTEPDNQAGEEEP